MHDHWKSRNSSEINQNLNKPMQLNENRRKSNEPLQKPANFFTKINQKLLKSTRIDEHRRTSMNTRQGFDKHQQKINEPYFSDFDDVILAYQQSQIDLHTFIWVRYNGEIEDEKKQNYTTVQVQNQQIQISNTIQIYSHSFEKNFTTSRCNSW